MIRIFPDLSMHDSAIAGGKGASLGEMTQAGFPIPDGFVVLSESFDQFLDGAELRQEIDAELRKCDREKMHTIERASERIQKMILEATMPSDIESEILEAYITLSKKQETTPPQEENPIPLQRRGGLPSEGADLVKEQGRSSISSADTQEALKKNNTAQPFLVAVRSSATAEDSHSAAWAGQLDSFLILLI